MSTSFAQLAAAPGTATPDPFKHVNYVLGMLLGVDDLNQDFAYLMGRNAWLARDAIGYGTMCGLRISQDNTSTGPRISVSAGTGLTPHGRIVYVHPSQCAVLNTWLAANQSVVQKLISSPLNSSIALYLALSYRDCAVDKVPIAGEPCRSADDMMAFSRRVDEFNLEFRTTAPAQREEDAIRDFRAWMYQVVISDTGPFTSLADFLSDMRAALAPGGSPPDPTTFFRFGSPLAGVQISRSDLPAFMEAAFRIWVTEIRPLFHVAPPSVGCSCDGSVGAVQDEDDALLLADVDVPLVMVGQSWQVDDTQPVNIDESRRPILVHARMMQEWSLAGPHTR